MGLERKKKKLLGREQNPHMRIVLDLGIDRASSVNMAEHCGYDRCRKPMGALASASSARLDATAGWYSTIRGCCCGKWDSREVPCRPGPWARGGGMRPFHGRRELKSPDEVGGNWLGARPQRATDVHRLMSMWQQLKKLEHSSDRDALRRAGW